MEHSAHKSDRHLINHTKRLSVLYLIFGGFHACVLPLALLFSLGPLITSRGRAWEYEPVRELFIASLLVFSFLVVLPLAVAYGLRKGHAWAKLMLLIAAMLEMLVGLLLAVSFVPELGFWGVMLPSAYLGLSAYSVWYIYRHTLSNNSFNRSAG